MRETILILLVMVVVVEVIGELDWVSLLASKSTRSDLGVDA